MTDTPTLTAAQIEALATLLSQRDHAHEEALRGARPERDTGTFPDDFRHWCIENARLTDELYDALDDAAPALIAAARTLADVPMKADAAAFGLKFFLRVHASEAGWDGINAAIDAAFAGLTRGLNDKAPAAPAETE